MQKKRKTFGFLLTFAAKAWLVRGVFRFQSHSGASPLPGCAGMRCDPCAEPSVQAEGWEDEDVPADMGGRTEGPWGRVGCGNIPAEVFKLLKDTLRRHRSKAALCRIDLGSDVMVRSRGDANADAEPLLLPSWG